MSEILNQFAKIGLEQGWIVKAAEEPKKKEQLYNLKQEDDILEKAHLEENMVVLRTHVPLNGVVLKPKEKQDVGIDIASRTPLGNYQQHLYIKAYQDLMQKTIKVAYELDNSEQVDLASLADICSNQLHKRAAWPAVVGVVAVVAALYGSLYSSNNPSAQGIKQDTMRALEKMKEVSEDDPQVGTTLQPLQATLNRLLQSATSFYQYNDEILNMMLRVTGTDSADDKRKAIATNVKELLEGPKHDQIIKDFENFKNVCQETSRLIPIATQILNSAEAQNRSPENSTWFALKKLIRDYVYNSSYQDLVKILGNLQEDISQVPVNIDGQLAKINDLKSKIQTLPSDLKDVLPAA